MTAPHDHPGRERSEDTAPTNTRPGTPDASRAFSSDAQPARPAGMPVGTGGVVDRRLGLDRREIQAAVAGRVGSDGEAPISGTGMDRRRGPGRRLSDFTKSAEEGQMTQEQFLFLMAIDAFKKANTKQFPSWTDVLEVIRLLGYRKTMPMELTLRAAEDWKEAADAPSNVRTERQVRRARGEAA
ncbi:MAG: hypothetical protein GC200_00120 [Tepidisphaera sp.]|nr:hypothetical protein [Tepidisphaera sp.]